MPFLPTSTLPLDFVRVSIIVVPVIPSPHCPLPTPPEMLCFYLEIQTCFSKLGFNPYNKWAILGHPGNGFKKL